MAFCSNDTLAEAVKKLKAGKRLTFAVSNSYGQHLIDPLVAVTGTPMKFVPYGSSGKSLKGFVEAILICYSLICQKQLAE